MIPPPKKNGSQGPQIWDLDLGAGAQNWRVRGRSFVEKWIFKLMEWGPNRGDATNWRGNPFGLSPIPTGPTWKNGFTGVEMHILLPVQPSAMP